MASDIGRQVPAASTDRMAPTSKAVHLTLYTLLGTEVVLGFAFNGRAISQ